MIKVLLYYFFTILNIYPLGWMLHLLALKIKETVVGFWGSNGLDA